MYTIIMIRFILILSLVLLVIWNIFLIEERELNITGNYSEELYTRFDSIVNTENNESESIIA